MADFYFPQGGNHPPAKLYKRHTYEQEIPLLKKCIVDGNVIYRPEANVMAELNNYTHYTSFRWTFQTEVQGQTGVQSRGIITDTKYATIRTNTREEITAGDIIQLDSPVVGGKRFFVVTQAQQLWAQLPKPVKSFQDLQLTSLL